MNELSVKEAASQRTKRFLRGKIALVTGAFQGIGRALVDELMEEHVSAIAMIDMNVQVQELAYQLDGTRLNGDSPIKVMGYVGDVTSRHFCMSVFDDVVERAHGIPRACFPVAGITADRLALDFKKCPDDPIYSIDTFRHVLEVDTLAPIYWVLEMCKRIAEDRMARGKGKWSSEEEQEGAAVFVSSVSKNGNAGQLSYATAKAGLSGAAATLALEMVFRGIHIGVVDPGYSDTEMVRKLGDDFINRFILPNTRTSCLIPPAEVASAICYLANHRFVTKSEVDAGWRK